MVGRQRKMMTKVSSFDCLLGYSCITIIVLLSLLQDWQANCFITSLSGHFRILVNETVRGRVPSRLVEGEFWVLEDNAGHQFRSSNRSSVSALGFCKVNGRFTLSIAIGLDLSSPPGVVVWSANRDIPVSENGVLAVDENGHLVLLEEDGMEVWSSRAGPVVGIELRYPGNLMLYDKNSVAIWESFRHPTDTLLPGQKFSLDTRLVSNASESSIGVGAYSLIMEPGGLILYVNSPNPLPYWTWGDLQQRGNATSLLRGCPSFVPEATFEENSYLFTLSFEKTGKGVHCPEPNPGPPMIVTNDVSAPTSSLRFLRLDADGNLRVYKLNSAPVLYDSRIWQIDFELFHSGTQSACKLPSICGPYGICSEGQCSCPQPNNDRCHNAFSPVDSFRPSQGCLPPRPLTCFKTSMDRNEFLQLAGVDHFSSEYNTRYVKTSSGEACQRLCGRSCPCVAAFFHQETGHCYSIQGSLTTSFVHDGNSSHTAFIKI
eukprot:c9338_g1_i1 orf=521-1981(+)